MKKMMKENTIKKIALIILIVFTFNIIVPTYSSAGWAKSLLSKPLATFCMEILGGVNLSLGEIFGGDEALESSTDTPDDDADKTEEIDLSVLDGKWSEVSTALKKVVLSPDDIFTGKVQIANANIFSDDFDEDVKTTGSDVNTFSNLMKTLKKTVAGLYYIMRNLAVVVLLSLLIYCGIRIVLSSNNPGEKSKWQMYLVDWIKALAIVMFVHVIMIGLFYIIDLINQGLQGSLAGGKKIGEMILDNFKDESAFEQTGVWIYIILYAYLTYMNLVFLIAYFKRLVFVMFMIVIAPITGALYPLGKQGHQIFSKWFKEFLSGLLVQPLHFLIYTILFGTVLKLMNDGSDGALDTTSLSVQLYCLISMAMIRPIEKFSRQIFNMGDTVMDNVASFESGHNTLKAGANAVIAVGSALAGNGAALITKLGGGNDIPQEGEGNISYARDNNNNNSQDNKDKKKKIKKGKKDKKDNDLQNGNDYSLQNGNDYSLQNGNGNNSKIAENTAAIVREENVERIQSTQVLSDNIANAMEEKSDDKNNLKLGNANIQINTASVNTLDTNSKDTNTGKENESHNGLDDTKKSTLDESEKPILPLNMIDNHINPNGVIRKEEDIRKREDNEKFSNKAKRGYEAVRDVIKSPESKENMLNIREKMHEFVDTLYIPGQASGDWKGGPIDLYNEQVIKPTKERLINNFVNNKGNIDKAIKAYDLKDKKDDKGNIVQTKEDQAKEKLKSMEVYVNKGFNDVYQIKALQDKGLTPNDAVRSSAKEIVDVHHFMHKKENAEQFKQTVVDKLPEEKRNDPVVVQQHMKQELDFAKPYIVSGAAKDVETLNRLTDLERKLDQNVQIVENNQEYKTDYVVRIDTAIQKAIKEGVSEIDLHANNNNNNASVKALQDVMNKVMNERKSNMNSNTRPSGGSSSVSSSRPSSGSSSRQSGGGSSSGPSGKQNSMPSNKAGNNTGKKTKGLDSGSNPGNK